ncbi:MAG: hypothetical protein AB8B56_11025 [Crocinitomicaceae bacterium]
MNQINKLRQILSENGYLHFYLAFGDGNKNVFQWQARYEKLENPLKDLVGLFLMKLIVKSETTRELLGDDVVDELIDSGILIEGNEGIHTDNLVLISFNSILFFCEESRDPQVYFGNDSIALGVYQTPLIKGKSLDLCAGSAIQSMIAAQTCDIAKAVEINPKAAKVAQFNIRFNNMVDRVSVENIPLEEFAEKDNDFYDLITFNPPLLPVPEPLFYPFVGDGGEDGLDVTRRILRAYIPKLTETGSIEFIGCGLGKDDHLAFAESLRPIFEEFHMDYNVHVLGAGELKRGDGAFDSSVYTTAMANGIDMEMCNQIYELHYEKLDVNKMYCFFIKVFKSQGDKVQSKVVRTTDKYLNWFVYS